VVHIQDIPEGTPRVIDVMMMITIMMMIAATPNAPAFL